MIDSCEIMFFVNGCSKTIEMKTFVVNGTILQKKITPIECQNQNTFTLNKSGNTTEPMRKRSDFSQAFSTLNRLHREAGGQQLRPMPYWRYKEWKPASSSSSTWWQYSKKVNKRGLRSNGATRCLQIFGENLRRMAFTNSFFFATDRLFTADGGLL